MLHGRSTEIVNPALAVVGVLDLAALTVLVAPLLLCGLLGLGLSRERQGSLGLMLRTSGIGAARVLLTRVGLALMLTTLSLAVAGGVIVAVAVAAGGSASGSTLAAWAAVTLGYLVFWAGAAALVAALARTETACAVALVALWFVLVALLPSLASTWHADVGRSQRITQALIAAQQSDAATPQLEDDAVLRAALAAVLQQPVPHLAPCAANRQNILEDYAARFAYDRPIRAALAEQLAAGNRNAPWWSPVSVVTARLTHAVGNHTTAFHAFALEAAEFHHRYRAEILRRLVACDAIDAAENDALPSYTPSASAPPPVRVPAAALAAAGVALLVLAAAIAQRVARTH